MITYAIVNESTAPEITDAWLKSAALDMQRAYDEVFAPAWNTLPVTIQVGGTGDRILRIVDNDDMPGALAYHTEINDAPALVAIVSAIRSEGGNLLDALTVAFTHEVFETACNEDVNLYVDVGKPLLLAREVCDPVQGATWTMGGTLISDFVLRSYFDSEGSAPFSHCSTVGAAFGVAVGGYQTWSDGSQTFGERGRKAAERAQKYGRGTCLTTK